MSIWPSILPSRPPRSNFQYLNPKRCEELDAPDASGVRVECYFNGLYSVCPNPTNLRRVKSLEESYDRGEYVSKFRYHLSQADFDNPENWNS